jgi:hypothetical protein
MSHREAQPPVFISVPDTASRLHILPEAAKLAGRQGGARLKPSDLPRQSRSISFSLAGPKGGIVEELVDASEGVCPALEIHL